MFSYYAPQISAEVRPSTAVPHLIILAEDRTHGSHELAPTPRYTRHCESRRYRALQVLTSAISTPSCLRCTSPSLGILFIIIGALLTLFPLPKNLQIHIHEEAVTSMFYVYISLWAGARSRKPIVQRCVDYVLTTLTLGTPLGVCRCPSSDEVP